ncbi:hypothetical protein OG21DRAFT_567040 [Imleria badia]|nr:hypothetical protein OG21DRAFT_567040 [Imleria badia]
MQAPNISNTTMMCQVQVQVPVYLCLGQADFRYRHQMGNTMCFRRLFGATQSLEREDPPTREVDSLLPSRFLTMSLWVYIVDPIIDFTVHLKRRFVGLCDLTAITACASCPMRMTDAYMRFIDVSYGPHWSLRDLDVVVGVAGVKRASWISFGWCALTQAVLATGLDHVCGYVGFPGAQGRGVSSARLYGPGESIKPMLEFLYWKREATATSGRQEDALERRVTSHVNHRII